MNIQLAREILNRKSIPIWDIELNKYYMYDTERVLLSKYKLSLFEYIVCFTNIEFLPFNAVIKQLNGKILHNENYAQDYTYVYIDDLIPEIKLMLL